MGNTGLRTSLIWHDEVMSDLVHEKPAKVTIGSSGEATFTTPDVGAVTEYAIVTPGKRGYLLTLSARMSGTICLGGVEHEVGAFVRAAEEPGGFRATPIGGNDWGVINLDASGDHKLFFQFVPLEEAEWNLGHPMILAAVGGFALSVAAMTGVWWAKGVPLGEAAFRAGSLSSLAIGFAAIVRWVLEQDNESRASLAFSVMLHAAILFATFQLYDRGTPVEDFTKPTLAGAYKVDIGEYKPVPKPEPTKPEPTVKPGAAVAAQQQLPVRHPWQRPKGKKVEKPSTEITQDARQHDETGPGRIPSTKIQAPAIGVLAHEDLLHGVLGRDVTGAVDKFEQLGGNGPGTPGDGPPDAGGPGNTVGGGTGNGIAGTQKKGPPGLEITVRPAVCMGDGCGSGPGPTVLPPRVPPPPDKPTLTKEEIDQVIKSRQNMYRTCYDKEIQRDPSLQGDILLHFEITPAGRVVGAKRTGGSLGSDAVVQCVKNALAILHFPEKGGAIVNYPFVFSVAR